MFFFTVSSPPNTMLSSFSSESQHTKQQDVGYTFYGTVADTRTCSLHKLHWVQCYPLKSGNTNNVEKEKKKKMVDTSSVVSPGGNFSASRLKLVQLSLPLKQDTKQELMSS